MCLATVIIIINFASTCTLNYLLYRLLYSFLSFTIHSWHVHQPTDLLDPTISTLRAALISVVCSSILTSAVMFVVGVVCGHCISQRWRVSAAGRQRKEQESSATNEDLELKENVAYITLHPK